MSARIENVPSKALSEYYAIDRQVGLRSSSLSPPLLLSGASRESQINLKLAGSGTCQSGSLLHEGTAPAERR